MYDQLRLMLEVVVAATTKLEITFDVGSGIVIVAVAVLPPPVTVRVYVSPSLSAVTVSECCDAGSGDEVHGPVPSRSVPSREAIQFTGVKDAVQ